MNQNHLKTFTIIAEHGSFSKAAKVMNISTQALLQQMQILERDIGAPLFYRSHLGVSLTPAGNILYEGAGHILSYTETIKQRCEKTLSVHDELHVGTSNEITPSFLYQIAYEFKATYPKTSMHIMYIDSVNKFADLLSGKLDLCENFLIDTIAQYGLEFYPVLNTQIYCIVSKKHPLAKRQSLCPHDLKGETILLSTSQTDSFGNPQIEPPDEGITYLSYQNLTGKMLETSLGNAVYFDYLLDPLDNDKFAAIPYSASKRYTFGFIYKPNPPKNVERFLSVASKYRIM